MPSEHGIRGLHGATLWENGDSGSAAFLAGTMGFEPAGEEDGLLRLQAGNGGVGSVVYLRRTPGFWRGAGGVGTVHHVAFRAATDRVQLDMRTQIVGQGRETTPVIDRQYFRSIYFTEPGGVLFEIATDGPGFAIDESPAELGTRLKLPPMFETRRTAIEARLPPLRLPQAEAEGRR